MANKLAAIRKACRINDFAIAATIKNFCKFKTERDVACFLNKQIRFSGAKLAFPTIVANSKHVFELHHKPCNTKLKRGFVVIDFGAKVAGWCSDVSRTIFIGVPTQKEIELYKLVRKAQVACVKMAKPNVLCSEIDHKAVLLLEKYSPNFIHAVGHGIGREVHAKPAINSRSADRLQAGDVIAIEPGIYFKKKFGIRIEDTVLITRKAHEVLSQFPKKLICINL